MVKSAIYHGGTLVGEAEVNPVTPAFATWNRDIRISHFSTPSERCPPLAVLHTIATGGVCFRVESELPSPPEESLMFLMHNACSREKKTAVMPMGDTEIHLVAMASRNPFRNISCFWGFSIPTGLYNSCLVLLNIRCLGIVFDLDETLIVANTSRSFEDKIDALQRKINSETDPQRASVMLAEVKRYQDDRFILKQYTENDQVFDNGMLFKAQSEVVPPMSDGQQPIVRPVIRLHEKNIILTRINPSIRDTSVLVKLRPGWEDLRNYLTAKGRKRFEVYVCTMAERDYALEMWRLLDPELNLINARQLLDRIVCVKSGLRKSLLNVFHDGICHPKLALVIDDRLKVWDDVDQPRVHVVPAFAPYYAPQAETNGSVPVLFVARNVACSVRACFFKEFDESLLPSISTVCYEDDISGFSPAPDVGNHLNSEDDTSASNGHKDPLSVDGLTDTNVERLKEVVPPVIHNIDLRIVSCLPQTLTTSSSMVPPPAPITVVPPHSTPITQIITPMKPLGHSVLSEPSIQGSPAREEGEVPESELDPDTRRRLLILQHGQDTRDHTVNDAPLPPARPLQMPIPPVPSRGSWFPMDGELSPRQPDRMPKDYSFESGARFDKKRYSHPPFFRDMENRSRSNKAYNENNRFPRKTYRGDDQAKAKYSATSYGSFPGEETSSGRLSSSNRNAHFDSEQVARQYSGNYAEVLRDIATKCGTKVEFRPFLDDSIELHFGFEVWFAGEKFGEGVGRTRKEAQLHASENSLKSLANRYISNPTFGSISPGRDMDNPSNLKPNGLVSNSNSLASRDDSLQQSQFLDPRVDGCTTPSSSISALKELCTLQGFRLTFQVHPSVPMDSATDGQVYAQVEVSGEVLGKGNGATWEEAKSQAAEEALENLNSSNGQFILKRSGSPRSMQTSANKRLKTDLPRSLQRFSSSRYSKSGMSVP